MSYKFGQGDIVRVVEGPHAGREGAIYDAIGIPRDHWTRLDPGGGLQYRVYFDIAAQTLDADWLRAEVLELVKPMPAPAFQSGDRVRVCSTAEWAAGELGTVNQGAWTATVTPRITRRGEGPTRVHMVRLDHPHEDGSEDGFTYVAGEFAEAQLELVDDPRDRAPAYDAARLAAEGDALRQVMKHPESGEPIKHGQAKPTQ
jgi:hypothetical protein